MEVVKIKLPHWDENVTYYEAEKIPYINHRGVTRIKYRVILRVTIKQYPQYNIHTLESRGTIYEENDVIEF